MTVRAYWVAAALALAVPAPVFAGEAGDILRNHLYAGTLSEGLEALKPLAEAGDSEALFGVGALTFVSGIESLAGSLYHYGVAAPETGMMGPDLAMPLPVNPDPAPLDYAGVRAMLQTLVDDMDSAKAQLVLAGQGADFVVVLDPLKFRFDLDGNGESESVAEFMAQQFGMEFDTPVEPPVDDGLSNDKNRPSEPEATAPDTSVGFDRADAIWLAGYSQVFASQADYLLAHDFSDLVNATFHRLFPLSGLPMQAYSEGGTLFIDAESDAAIADAVAFIHTLNWPVVEPERLKGVLTRLQSITALSRENWKAILAETDDEREFIPNPGQTAIIPDGTITQEMVDAWQASLDTFDAVLKGELLLPHWRFKQGFDLKAYFETATRTDLVMILTGLGALPYLKDGPIADANSFAAANEAFGDRFLGFAFYFN